MEFLRAIMGKAKTHIREEHMMEDIHNQSRKLMRWFRRVKKILNFVQTLSP
jgi:hypothetical protein